MSFLRELLYEPVTLRFLLLTLAFIFMAAAFVMRLVRKEELAPPPRRFVPPPAPVRPVQEEIPEPIQQPPQAAVESASPAQQVIQEARTEVPQTQPEETIPVAPSAQEPEPPQLQPASYEVPVAQAAPVVPQDRFFFEALQNRPSFAGDLLRAVLAILALLVLGALTIVVLPQWAFDRVADGVRIRKGPVVPQEMIALLYLGEEAKGSDFHIRGVVRNILTRPVEQLDANVRLYAPDRTLLESAIVRMDVELIPPDSTASFHLTYPDYHGQFGSYSIDFKLRQGDPVPYKDMRALHTPE